MRTCRRIKNVICILEIDPNQKSLLPQHVAQGVGGDPKSTKIKPGTFTNEQEQYLLRCFSLADTDLDGRIDYNDYLRITKLMGVDVNTATATLQRYDANINLKGFTYEVFREIFYDLESQYRRQGDRSYVLLSIEEAEHIRGILHSRDSTFDSFILGENTSLSAATSVGLWLMGDNGVTLLAQSKGFKQQVEQGPHQAMTACYQFINSDIHFDQMGILVLLRVLENTPVRKESSGGTVCVHVGVGGKSAGIAAFLSLQSSQPS